MHAQLQVRRQAELLDREGDHREVVAELLLELREVADVIDALVEPAGELRGDRLHRHALVRERREDEQQLGRRLRGVGLVHRDFGDEVAAPFAAAILR